MRILLVDDDTNRAARLRKHLEESLLTTENVSIEAVQTTGEARQHLRSTRFDAIVLDVVLPRRLNGSQSAEYGLELLEQIATAQGLIRPERIIGITAHTEDIHAYRDRFEALCSVVIGAPRSDSSWMSKISESLVYVLSGRRQWSEMGGRTAVITFHGIRTTGGWQKKLESEISRKSDTCDFFTYKYGYYSAVGLLIPWIRRREVRRLKSRINAELDLTNYSHICVFAHSFGTYLAVKATEGILEETELSGTSRLTLVLGGSVLHQEREWHSGLSKNGVSVINDCAQHDLPLLFSQAFCLRLGMAGRHGFIGFNRPRHLNRYFQGGHSVYFEGDDFLSRYWVPVALGDNPHHVDLRTSPGRVEIFAEKVAVAVGRILATIFIFAKE